MRAHSRLLGAACAVGSATFLVAAWQRPATPPATRFDAIIRHGLAYDGSGNAPRVADIGVIGDRIAFVGDLASATAGVDVDATGLAVAPGFINMLS
jgi:N-acyl-D-amino-acid deacylase